MLRRPWVATLALVAIVILAPVSLLGVLRLGSSESRLPSTGRLEVELTGCPAPFQVILDHRGVPHVRAESVDAAWFAQGWLHARERFLQMEIGRRAAAGRLAEVFGEAAVPLDRKMRIWRVDAIARRQASQLDPSERAALDAYAAGVNAALTSYGRWIAPEVWLLAVDPEPWEVEDTLRIGVLLQLNLSWSMGEELRRAVVLSRLGRERAVELWGWTPSQSRDWIPPLEYQTGPRRPEEAITPPLSGEGSNNWAIAPSRTASGRPLLANDPHIGVSLPATWYAVHLEAPGLHVAGASLPGGPGVVIGHTEQVAWGFTMSLLDDQDLWMLTLDDAGEAELIDGTWQPLRTVTERIGVRWREEPTVVKVRLSERGPIVRESRREVLAMSWTALEGTSPVAAFLAMNRARSVNETVDAWRGITGPSMNLVAADVDGHIVHQVVGLLPDRRAGAGRLPAPGADTRWAWRGVLPLDANPRVADPPEGFVATANHDVFAEGGVDASTQLPGDFATPWRIRRIRSELASTTGWDVARCVELQGDLRSLRAVAMLKLLRPSLDNHPGRTADLLSNWDASMTIDDPAPHAFVEFVEELAVAVGGDEALRAGLPWSPVGPEELLRLLAGGLGEGWWDDVETASVEDRSAIVARVLRMLDEGASPEPWGEVHQVRFDHPLRAMPVLGHLLGRSWSRGPIPAPGDGTTVNAHYWDPRDPFAVTAIPSMRFVADVGAWDDTVLVLPLGQSGRPWSDHYADQLEDWRAVRPARLPFSRAAVDRAARALLEVRPAGTWVEGSVP
jgi:penicillin amidase